LDLSLEWSHEGSAQKKTEKFHRKTTAGQRWLSEWEQGRAYAFKGGGTLASKIQESANNCSEEEFCPTGKTVGRMGKGGNGIRQREQSVSIKKLTTGKRETRQTEKMTAHTEKKVNKKSGD